MLLKRLNKPADILPIGGIFLLSLMMGCQKKNRLSASNFNFSITPPAAFLVKGESITLKARGSSSQGAVDVNPTWTVTPSTVGTLSSSIGTTVVFQSLALGDAVVSATFDGLQATAHLPVGTYRPTASTFDVYNDNGLPSGSDVDSDIFVTALALTELSSGYCPEGVKYMRATGSSGFWGVTLDKNGSGKKKDLSQFSGGTLKFSLRLVDRTLVSGEILRIEITDTVGSTIGTTLATGTDFDSFSTNWQEIVLPIGTRFPGLDLTKIKVPFAVVLLGLTQPLSFDVDAVRWEK